MPNAPGSRKPLSPTPAALPERAGPAADPRRSERPPIPGPAILVAAAILFGFMAVLAKGLTASLPGPEVALVRFAVGLGACGLAAFKYRLRAHNWFGLALRGGFGGTAVLLYFLAIAHLPVGLATLLNYTAPVFTAIYAALFLGERTGWGALGALFLTTSGIGCVIRADAPPGAIGFGSWELVGIASAALSGAAVATIRELRRTDGSWEIFAAFCVFGGAVTLVPAATSWVEPTSAQWAGLFGVGGLSVAAQILMTYALRFVPATIAGILAQLTPVSAMVLGWLFFGEHTTGLAALGAALTLVGVSLGARLEPRGRRGSRADVTTPADTGARTAPR